MYIWDGTREHIAKRTAVPECGRGPQAFVAKRPMLQEQRVVVGDSTFAPKNTDGTFKRNEPPTQTKGIELGHNHTIFELEGIGGMRKRLIKKRAI